MTGQANFLQSLGWAVVNSLWQLALLWIIYQILASIFKTARPAAKSLLASSLLIAGFAWFVFTFLFTFYTSNESDQVIAAGLLHESDAGVANWLQQSLPVASTLYLLLLIIPVFRFIRNYRYVQVIRRYGLSKPAPEWRIFVNSIAARMGIRKPVHIWISEWVSSPVTIGFLKPIILVPMAAINHLGTEQMEAVLLHELSHIRRYDYLLNLIINFIKTLLYFNPFVKAFVKIIEREREKSCDEMVIQFQYDSYQYASALLTLEKASREYQLLVIGAAGHNDLLQRIEKIMGIRQKQGISLRQIRNAMAALICIVSVNLLLVFGKPLTQKITALYSMGSSSSLLKNSNDLYASAERRQHVSNNLPDIAGKILNPKERQLAGASFAFAPVNPEIINASLETEIVPEVKLDKFEEAQVKEAIDVSKKVLEDRQWKTVEKTLADVFNQQEKESLKTALKDEMEKIDWSNWENKLRLAYDKVDWDKVNNQLYDAINKIQTDSLVKVYSDAIVSINQAQRELNSHSLQGIPDTDISLKALSDKQRSLQRALINLKATRTKKIVHL